MIWSQEFHLPTKHAFIKPSFLSPPTCLFLFVLSLSLSSSHVHKNTNTLSQTRPCIQTHTHTFWHLHVMISFFYLPNIFWPRTLSHYLTLSIFLTNLKTVTTFPFLSLSIYLTSNPSLCSSNLSESHSRQLTSVLFDHVWYLRQHTVCQWNELLLQLPLCQLPFLKTASNTFRKMLCA